MGKENSAQLSLDTNFEHKSTDDELNLLDILRVLWRYRWVILTITFLFTLVSLVYCLLVQDRYSVQTKIQTVVDPHEEKLRAENSELKSIYPDSGIAFEYCLQNIKNRKVQAQFWKDKISIENQNIKKTDFLNDLTVNGPPRNQRLPQVVVVSFKGDNPDNATAILNELIQYINEYTRKEVLDYLSLNTEARVIASKGRLDSLERIEKAKIQQKLSSIELDISIEKNRELQKLDNSLYELKNKISLVALQEKYQMKKQLNELLEQRTLAEKIGVVKMPENLSGKPAYMRGIQAIDNEIVLVQKKLNSNDGIPKSCYQIELEENVKSIQAKLDKKNISSPALDDLFFKKDKLQQLEKKDYPIEGVEGFKDKLFLLEKIKWDDMKLNGIKAGPVSANLSFPKNKKLIVVVGGILGLILGMGISFLIALIESSRKQSR